MYTASKTAVEGFSASLAYAAYVQGVFSEFSKVSVTTSPAHVVEAVWRAANDASDQLHFPAGPDAMALANAKR